MKKVIDKITPVIALIAITWGLPLWYMHCNGGIFQ